MGNKKPKPGEVYSVYAVTIDSIPGKVYIGMTCNPEHRFITHVNNCIRRSMSECPKSKLYNAYRDNKCKKQEVKLHIIESGLTFDEANEKEYYYIEQYRSYDERYGWNTSKRPYVRKTEEIAIDTIAPPLPKFEEE